VVLQNPREETILGKKIRARLIMYTIAEKLNQVRTVKNILDLAVWRMLVVLTYVISNN
jgi:hypothetical protein